VPEQTVVFFTLQTSGTGSIWRILNLLDGQRRIPRLLGHETFVNGLDFMFDLSELPTEGHLVLANSPAQLSADGRLDGLTFLVNFRDPRDRLCNEYAWLMAHPMTPNETQAEIEARAAALRETGIDGWVRKRMTKPMSEREYYRYFMTSVEKIPEQQRRVNSYARLCLDFDSFVERSCSVLGVELTPELKQTLDVERTENLARNPAWIGNIWQGSDIMPGRYKHELQPDTIELLSERYADVLRTMARHDPDYAHTYLENVGKGNIGKGMAVPASGAALPKAMPEPSNVVVHRIVDRPDLRVDHFRSVEKRDKLVFTFTERGNKNLDGEGFGTNFLLRRGFDVIAIKTNKDVWYENLRADDFAEIERWLSWASTPYRVRMGYGSGMGAYASIRFSGALRLDRVLALSPLFSIGNDWDSRCRGDLAGMSGDPAMFRLPDEIDAGEAQRQISDSCEYLIVTDPFCLDSGHIRRFRRIIPADRLTVTPVPFAGHATRAYLSQGRLLDEVILSGLNKGSLAFVSQKVRARRSQAPVHLLGLANFCLRRGHLRWAQAINARLLGLGDKVEYHLQTAQILDRIGQTDEALALIDAKLASADEAARAPLQKYRNGILSRRSDTVIFYTTQTSAAGSIFRIMSVINQSNDRSLERTIRILGHELYMKGPTFTFDWKDLSATGLLVKANCPTEIRPIRDLGGQKFLVNFRDPRDRLCNEYAWQMVHPLSPDEPQADIDARAARIAELGIDKWIVSRMTGSLPADDYFTLFLRDIQDIPEANRVINTYARLCLNFDSFIERTCEIMGVPLTDALRQALEVERTDKLEQNSKWIGQRWKGSDTMPGRYQRELQPETIALLSERYAPVLREMARIDPDYAHLYLEGIPEGTSWAGDAQLTVDSADR